MKFIFLGYFIMLQSLSLVGQDLFSLILDKKFSKNAIIQTSESDKNNPHISIVSVIGEKDSCIRFIVENQKVKKYIVFTENIYVDPAEDQYTMEPYQITSKHLRWLRSKLVDSYLDGDDIIEIVKDEEVIYQIKTSLKNNNYSVTKVMELSGNENVLTHFYRHNRYHFLSYFEKKNEVIVYKIDHSGQVNKQSTTVTDSSLFVMNKNFFSHRMSFGYYLKYNKYVKLEENKNYHLSYFARKGMHFRDSLLEFDISSSLGKKVYLKINLNDLQISKDSIVIPQVEQKEEQIRFYPYAAYTSSNQYYITADLEKIDFSPTLKLSVFDRNTKAYKQIKVTENSNIDSFFQSIKLFKKEKEIDSIGINEFARKLSSGRSLPMLKVVSSGRGLYLQYGFFSSKVTFGDVVGSILFSAMGTFVLNATPGLVGYYIVTLETQNAFENSISLFYDFKTEKFNVVDNLSSPFVKAKSFMQKEKIEKEQIASLDAYKSYIVCYINKDGILKFTNNPF